MKKIIIISLIIAVIGGYFGYLGYQYLNRPVTGGVRQNTPFRTSGNSIVSKVSARDFGIGNIATASADFSVDPGNNTIQINTILYTFPGNNGDSSQFLQTDGSGTLVWATSGVASNSLDFDEFVLNMTLNGNLTVASAGFETEWGGNFAVLNKFKVKALGFTPHPAQDITAASDTILASHSFLELNPNADLLMTSTPTIASASEGTFLILHNTSNFTMTLQDEDQLPGSAVHAAGGQLVIEPSDTIGFIYHGGADDTGWHLLFHPTLEVTEGSGFVAVRNTSGSTITAGTPVYQTGYNNGQKKMTIAPADADSASTMPFVGIMVGSLSNNTNGTVQTSGISEPLDTSAFSTGDILYISGTAGTFTATRPLTGEVQPSATVLRSNASNGVLLVQGAMQTNEFLVPNNLTSATGLSQIGIGKTPTTTLDVSGSASISIAFEVGGYASLSQVLLVGQNSNKVATISGDFIPSADGTYRLGTPTIFWDFLGVDDIEISRNDNPALSYNIHGDSNFLAFEGRTTSVGAIAIHAQDNESEYLHFRVDSNAPEFATIQTVGLDEGLRIDTPSMHPENDSTTDLGSSTRFWDEIYGDELVLQEGTMGTTATNQVRLAGLDLSAGDSGLHIKTENDTEHLFASLVGIGKTNPTTELDIVGSASVSVDFEAIGYASVSQLYIQDGTEALPSYAFADDKNSGMFRVSSDKWALSAGGVEFITLIETSQDLLVINDDGDDIDFKLETSQDTETIFVDGNSGRVAIGGGETSPDALLEVQPFATFGAGLFKVSSASGTSMFVINSNGRFGIGSETSPDAAVDINPLSTHTAPLLIVASSGNTRFHITGAGNIGIGDSSPTEALLVVGNAGTGDIYATFADNTTSDTLCWDGTGASLIDDCTSLREHKGEIEDLPFGLSVLMQLQPRIFRWKTNGTLDLGFIAEEVELVEPLLASYARRAVTDTFSDEELIEYFYGNLPDVVLENMADSKGVRRDLDELENPSIYSRAEIVKDLADNLRSSEEIVGDWELSGVKYRHMVALLVQGIQELEARVVSLEGGNPIITPSPSTPPPPIGGPPLEDFPVEITLLAGLLLTIGAFFKKIGRGFKWLYNKFIGIF